MKDGHSERHVFKTALELTSIWGQTALVLEEDNYSGPETRTSATRYDAFIL